MSPRRSLLADRAPRHLLMLGASIATLACSLGTSPVQAQSIGGLLGQQVRVQRPQAPQPGVTPVRSPTMRAALTRQQTTQSRIAQIRAYAASVKQAATRAGVTDGLSAGGLDPTDAIREAIAATKAGNSARANELLISAGAGNDLTGMKTWQGAGLPGQTIVDGRVTVTIDQTQERALLSWNRFDIGANTTLQFNQKANGVAQPDWVAVNRVTNATDPSLILGNLKVDGTVVVINQSGIVFGKNSQVNTHSLLASTLDIGNAVVNGVSGQGFAVATVKQRNDYYLANGLFAPANGTIGTGVNSKGSPLLVSGSVKKEGTSVSFADAVEGGISVDAGAQLETGTGGFLILAAPTIDSAGTLRAVEGQVSLQAGRAVTFVQSTGATTDTDPYVRGYKLNSYSFDLTDAVQGSLAPRPNDGKIIVRGLVESRRGYLSLGTGASGTIEQNGLLSTTTSVSRNGKISLTAGNILLNGNSNAMLASGIEMIADNNGETIPLGSANEPAGFKVSQLEIGNQFQLVDAFVGALFPTNFTMGQNALIYAPGANVSIGVTTSQTASLPLYSLGHIDIASGATIDVSGLKNVQLDASRNSIAITPVKRNELRDTPNYREVALDGNFSLNGATLYVDPRLSGVRDDGVAWVGSPLIEAGSLASQQGATAQEFMTKGGSVSLQTADVRSLSNVTLENAPSVHIARDATVDFSGGWVNYAAGTVRTSRLVTADGRIVDIGKANPNDVYVGVVDGFTEVQPRFGVVQTYLNISGQGQRYDPSYDEGRDAGTLRIGAAAVAIDGNVYGNGFAGSRQVAAGDRPSLKSILPEDGRLLQRSAYELPSGGSLSIDSLGDILVYHGERGGAESNWAELLLNDTMVNSAGLSALSLTAAGSVTFAGANPFSLQTRDALRITGASSLELAPGGALTVDAGRTIRFDGTVTANLGSIDARTQAFGPAQVKVGFPNGSIFRNGLYGDGNGDDVSFLYTEAVALNPFDIVVTGTLSTAGLWVNDFTEQGALRGGAFSNGGSISLTTTPNFFAAIGTDITSATRAVDLSGSIRVSGKLNLMSGGYVTSTGAMRLDGVGGDLSLINKTVYASVRLTDSGRIIDGAGSSDIPLGGDSQSVDFTTVTPEPNELGKEVRPNLVPDPRSVVDIASGTIQGFGFAGGGAFTLGAPNISFGSDNRVGSTHIGFDFFKTTGFGTLDISSYRSRIVDDIFTNERAGKSAFLETTRFIVGGGETFDLSQWLLPSILSVDQAKSLRALGTGADLSAQSYLSPSKPNALWDQKAASFRLGGLTELDVLAGGAIIGAPGASLTVGKLYSGGTITLHGGAITQRNDLVPSLVIGGLGIRDSDLGGNGLKDAFGGGQDSQGRFDENAQNAAGIKNANGASFLTNQQLVSRDGVDRLIYFLGKLDAAQGILLDSGSVTDLSGIALINPRAPFQPNGTQIRVGRVLDGGVLRLMAGPLLTRPLSESSQINILQSNMLIRKIGATLDISGASATFDQALALGIWSPYLEWSTAGRLSAMGGGSLGGTPIKARGGVAQAEGGTLEWLRPTIGTGTDGATNYLSVSMIESSGFDSLIARDGLTLDGNFALSLRKSFTLESQELLADRTATIPEARLTIAATAGTQARIGAGHVRIASRSSIIAGFSGGVTGDGKVEFVAGAQGVDLVGAILFDSSVASAALRASGDVRLTGVNDQPLLNTAYSGQLLTFGDLLIDARRTYATTGTGNLQGLLEGSSDVLSRSYDIAAFGDHSITFGNSYLDATAMAPLSAGTHVRVLAARIRQNGYLAAPLGSLELGSARPVTFGGTSVLATESVRFGADSVTTVSGAGLNIPYGSTTDLIEYYFPTIPTPITRLPTGQLTLSANAIVEDAGALIDGRGGGDIFAYEFQSGVGGSRDVLNRLNRDPFSSNDFNPITKSGYQYADHRQVFALVPAGQADKVAPYDPVYSADYGVAGPVDLYGNKAGLTVTLDGAPGVPAGEYLLVPAQYAMAIPGALRLVENTDANAPVPGNSATLLDGSIVVGGTYGYAGTGIAESTRRSFTVQSKETLLKYSQIITTGGTNAIVKNASDKGLGRPRTPLDAARVVLSPLSELKIAGAFDTRAGTGGQGGQFDLLGANIIVAADDSKQTAGSLTISTATLAGLNATSLLIGGSRSENADGTTAITGRATSISIDGGVNFDVPELLLAVSGVGSTLSIADGATLRATGALGTQPTSDYTTATAGSILRLASGGERLVSRSDTGASTIRIGASTISGGSLTLDTSGSFAVADAAALSATQVAISGGSIQFDSSMAMAGQTGVIGSNLEAKLANAQRLTIRSPGAIRFSAGEHRFNDLILDSATLAAGTQNAIDGSVTIKARDVQLLNAAGAADACLTAGFCGTGSSLTLNATTLSFGANNVRASGFSDSVTLAASNGIYVEGKGSFSTGNVALTLNTPFLVDRAAVADPREQKVRPDYSFLTSAGFTLSAPVGGTASVPTGNAAPGARINIGSKDVPVLSATVAGGLIRASAGIIDIESKGDILLSGATLSTPGFEKTFGDSVDSVIVSASGGTINLLSKSGNLSADAASKLIIDSGVGSAGTLNLLASNGAIRLDAAINPNVQGTRQGSFSFDSGLSTFAFDSFVTRYGQMFGGDVNIRSGAGDLSLAAGQKFRARTVSLTADGGSIMIGGTIDTSGVDVTSMTADLARNAAVNGGDIALWGRNGVRLTSTAKLDTHVTGYADTDSRVASAGDVTLGIEGSAAAITIESGAIIDVGARRTLAALAVGETGARLIPDVVTDTVSGNPVTNYRYAAPDTGGVVHLRAPVLGAGEDKVAVSLNGTIKGADSIQLEAFKRYDLDALASSGLYSGLTRDANGTLLLNMAASSASGGKFNPFTENFQLADGGSSVVRFIQNFDVGTVDGSRLDGVRLRPGIELASGGGIQTTTQWNLAAATFTPQQLEGAVAAGVLRVIPELSTGGQTQYAVVTGQEGALLDRFATFLYRVDGSARGEAPVITMRAGGDLIVNRSISDGFFTFRDKSDPAYINNQLGGGDRTYQPAILFTCGSTTGFCSNIVSYTDGIARNPGVNGTLTIGLGTQAGQGDIVSGAGNLVNSPLALAGNGAAGGGEGRDTLGFAELFPLLDGNVAMHSSDLRLVAGTDALLSANPLHVDGARGADMAVAGEYSYRVMATGNVSYSGALQFGLARTAGSPAVNFDLAETLDLTDTTAALNQLKDDAYTQLNWGSTNGLGTDARTAALAYFAGKGYRFVGSASAPTGIIAPLNQVVGFLKSFEKTYQAGLASNRTGYTANRTLSTIIYGNASQQTSPTATNQAYVRSYVRTGDGAIDVAAARDVDLRGASNLLDRSVIVYRGGDGTAATQANNAENPRGSAQFSAAAIYTAGVRVAPINVRARIVGGDLVSVPLDSPYLKPIPEKVDFIPSPKAATDANPVLAFGGGDISLSAGRDVLGHRDVWSERYLIDGTSYSGSATGISTANIAGTASQRWRVGEILADTEVGIVPRNFSAGVGALAGGDVAINAGRDVTELTVALTNGLSTASTGAGSTLFAFGNGNLALHAARDILAGRFDIASGTASIRAERNIAQYGVEPYQARFSSVSPLQFARIRIADAVGNISAGGSVTLASISALGVSNDLFSAPAAGFFSSAAAVRISANESIIIATPSIPDGDRVGADNYGLQAEFGGGNLPNNLASYIQILPPTVDFSAISGQIIFPSELKQLLYPSPIGQLRLLSDGDINSLSIAMSDADRGVLADPLKTNVYQFPFVIASSTDADLRNQHNRLLTHLGDTNPVRIYTNGYINQAAIFLPKQGRITAGGNITDMFFSGQNLDGLDITRIRAGGDITGSIGSFSGRPFVRSNNFILGGPGDFIIEAGRNLGPFVTSANIQSGDNKTYSFAGGIRTIGNDYNPWLSPQGADLQVRFGMGAGADYAALRETYLNPDNFAALDGDLFEQVTDSFGNKRPDRSKPIYAVELAEWLRDNAPADFATIFGEQSFSDTDASHAALAQLAHQRSKDLYQAFSRIDPLHQQDFLINDLYFHEIAEVGNVNGPSFQQYIRGYRAVQTLFPTRLGYTDNLAPYTLDPSTISQDHPLGVPVRNIVNGQPQRATRIFTGNVDLRLATIQTGRGGDITILGPGGDIIAGSVVRTTDQASRRATGFELPLGSGTPPALEGGRFTSRGNFFTSVPQGYEGLLTLQGGDIRSFTDGNFILNQSRAFTQQGGDIVMWSSNGDLNAGQGPKSAANFPPVTLRFDENGFGEVNSAGSVSGAGIGTFKRTPEDPASDVILIAPVGEVDAGDAGVRASGNVVVAAARVANADNFKAVGDITGVPGQGATTVGVAPVNSNEAQAQLQNAMRAAQPPADRRSIITVNVLGAVDDAGCGDQSGSDGRDCGPPGGSGRGPN